MRNLEQLILATEARYLQNQEQREFKNGHLRRLGRGGDWRKVDTPNRIRTRLERLGYGDVIAESMADVSTTRRAPSVNVLERIIGDDELMRVAFLLKGAAASRSVGRVLIRSASGLVQGFGTGFMASPRLLMTNNHVLETAESASHSQIQFSFYETFSGDLVTPVEFDLEPDGFFITDPGLDFTLVAVSEFNAAGDTLQPRGWNPLIRESGKAIVGERVNIIQHPGGEPMQLALRQNQIVDILNDFLHYTTDTQPGSSGSPVFNDQWEVAALHHSGVPERNDRGEIMLVTGIPWDGSEANLHLISWIANEGARISQIVEFIDDVNLDIQRQRLFDQSFTAPPVFESASAAPSAVVPSSPSMPGMVLEPDGTTSWLFRVNMGPISGDAAASATSAAPRSTDAVAPTPKTQPQLRKAQAMIEAASDDGPYYDAASDASAREAYYQAIAENLNAVERFQALHDLLQSTHTEVFSYRAARWEHLYPTVDRHETGKLRNIYSGTLLDPVEMLRQELVLIEGQQGELMRLLQREAMASDEERLEALDLLEAQLPFNCEHVVPQSWFDKKQPMRADLHHLFACEPACNSFRSNVPYFQFSPLEEVVRSDCGRREEGKFEPEFGRGAAARATLYFLIRYPGKIGDEARELQKERFEVLKSWHQAHPVDRYELHRNATIHAAQGNRNPLIDFPEWIDRIDFSNGFG